MLNALTSGAKGFSSPIHPCGEKLSGFEHTPLASGIMMSSKIHCLLD